MQDYDCAADQAMATMFTPCAPIVGMSDAQMAQMAICGCGQDQN